LCDRNLYNTINLSDVYFDFMLVTFKFWFLSKFCFFSLLIPSLWVNKCQELLLPW
jgi:hypothetical protein